MKNRFSVLALLALTLSTSAFAQDETYTLKRVAKVGEVMKMRLTGTFKMEGFEGEMTMDMTDKVTVVAANGDITSDSTSDLKIKAGGMEIPVNSTSTTTSSVLNDILKIKSDNENDLGYRAARLNTVRFSDKALKVGESWSGKMKGDAKFEGIDAEYKGTLVAVEDVNGVKCAKVTFHLNETGSGDAVSDGTYWFNLSNGNLVKGEGKLQNLPTPNGKIGMTFKIEAV